MERELFVLIWSVYNALLLDCRVCAKGTKMHLHFFRVKIAMFRQHTAISLTVIFLLFFWHLIDSRSSSNLTFAKLPLLLRKYILPQTRPPSRVRSQFLEANGPQTLICTRNSQRVCESTHGGPPLDFLIL